MLPFAETVLAWRLARGLTQAALAEASGVSRPNLSAIERGNREVTMKTLRALAAALDVRPGILADGEAPQGNPRPLGREALERVAGAAVENRSLADPREATLARNLGAVMASRISRGTGAGAPSRGRRRAADRAYFLLRSIEPHEVIATLVQRTTDRLARK